jgi:hypothetical protein
MTHAARTPAADRNAASPLRAPRRQRLGAAVASIIVTCFVFGGVVLGMTSTGDAGEAVVAQSHVSAHA